MSEDIFEARVGDLRGSRIHRVDEAVDVLRVFVRFVNPRQRRPFFSAEVRVALGMLDEPRWTLGNHEKEDHDHDREKDLEGEGSAPRDGAVEEEEAEASHAFTASANVSMYRIGRYYALDSVRDGDAGCHQRARDENERAANARRSEFGLERRDRGRILWRRNRCQKLNVRL